MKKMLYIVLALILLCIIVGTYKQNKDNHSTGDAKMTYEQITQEEAKRLMANEEGYIILDARTESEYATGHIPGAICIPNETIGTEAPAELADKDQLILVYCRSGNRSKQAAKKLAMLGYTNIKEFGGIMEWTGDIE